MKRLIVEDENDLGLELLVGEKVFLFCANYFYTGLLIGTSKTEALLKDCEIVYETGPFSEQGWKDAERISFSNEHYVRIRFIESYSKVEVFL